MTNGPSHSGAEIHTALSDRGEFFFKSGKGPVADRLQAQVEQTPLIAPLWGVRPVQQTMHSTKDPADGQRVVVLVSPVVRGPGLALCCDRWRDHLEVLIRYLKVSMPGASIRVRDRLSGKLLQVLHWCSVNMPEDTLEARTALVDWFLGTKPFEAPAGRWCHGDLTLCNVLCDCADRGEVAKGAIALVDYTRSFLASPILDVADLRQDSYHGWVNLEEERVPPERLEEADRLIVEAFNEETWWPDVGYYQTLKLLRILPYATSGVVTSWVAEQLRRRPWKPETSSS